MYQEVLKYFTCISNLLLTITHEIDTIIIFILQMRQLNVKNVAQNHTASKCQR